MTHEASPNGPSSIEPLLAESPRPMSPFIRAAGLQICLTFVTFLILDGGFVAFVFIRVSLAYWAGVLFIIARRQNSMTTSDQVYLKHGLWVALAISLPIASQLAGMVGPDDWMFLRKALGLF